MSLTVVRVRVLSYEQCTIHNVTNVIYVYSNYMFWSPGLSSGSMEDYNNQLYIRKTSDKTESTHSMPAKLSKIHLPKNHHTLHSVQ
jgi:hypothetical protein